MARLDAIQRGPRAVAFKLQAGEPVSQDVVEVGDALLNHLVEAAEPLLGVADLRLQRRNPAVDFQRPFRRKGGNRSRPPPRSFSTSRIQFLSQTCDNIQLIKRGEVGCPDANGRAAPPQDVFGTRPCAARRSQGRASSARSSKSQRPCD